MTNAKPTAWDDLLSTLVSTGVIPDVINRTLLWGPPRTGKTSLAVDLFHGKVERTTIHRQMPVDDLVGGYALKDGATVWMDGPAVRAMRKGIPLILDEIDQFGGEIRSLLHAILDDPAGVTLASGERVTARKGYAVIATTNALPSSLPAAIFDRFDLVLKADTLSAGLQSALGNLVEPAQTVVAREAGTSEFNWSRPASVNLFLAAAKLRRTGMPDDLLVKALGLTGQEATDFLIAISS